LLKHDEINIVKDFFTTVCKFILANDFSGFRQIKKTQSFISRNIQLTVFIHERNRDFIIRQSNDEPMLVLEINIVVLL